METTNDKLISSLFGMSRLIRQKMFAEKCFCDLSHSEMEVLMFLKENGTSTMKAISDYLRIKPPSATPIVEKLFNKKILKRIQDKTDRRITYVALTKSGFKEVYKKHKKIRDNVKKIFTDLNEANKKELIKILNVILTKHE